MSIPLVPAALGPQEFLIIFAVVLLLFGASAIPKLARSLGKAQGEFQRAKSDFDKEVKAGREESAAPEEAKIRQSARDLGIDESGMELDEVKKAINAKLA